MPLTPATCAKCGARLEPDAACETAFCPFCGAPYVREQTVQNVPLSGEEDECARRAEALERISDMIRYFGQRKDQYGALEWLIGETERRKKGVSRLPLYIGSVLTATFLVAAFLPASNRVITTFGVVLLIPGLSLIAGYVLLWAVNKNKLIEAQSQRKELEESLLQYYENYPDCPVGFEYTHPEDLEEIRLILQKGKASSVKEALHLFLQTGEPEE